MILRKVLSVVVKQGWHFCSSLNLLLLFGICFIYFAAFLWYLFYLLCERAVSCQGGFPKCASSAVGRSHCNSRSYQGHHKLRCTLRKFNLLSLKFDKKTPRNNAALYLKYQLSKIPGCKTKQNLVTQKAFSSSNWEAVSKWIFLTCEPVFVTKSRGDSQQGIDSAPFSCARIMTSRCSNKKV